MDRVPNATLVGGTPEGVEPDDIEGRVSEVWTTLGGGVEQQRF